MVALRGKTAKAKTANRKTVEKSVTVMSSSVKGKQPVENKAGKAATAAMTNPEINMTREEQTYRFFEFLTQSMLGLNQISPFNVTGFLDAMLVAACSSKAEKISSPQQILSQLASADRKRLCAVIFSADEIAYSCRNCQVDSTCVVCKDCFMHGDHSGHDVYFQRTTAGSSCDCGDSMAWKRSGFCSRHPGVCESQGVTRKKDELPQPIRMVAPAVIDAAVESIHLALLGLEHGFELAEAMGMFTENVPEHILRELVPSKTDNRTMDGMEQSRNRRTNVTGSIPTSSMASERTGVRRTRRSVRQSVSRALATTDTSTSRIEMDQGDTVPLPFAIHLHKDDIHSLRDVMHDLCSAIECTKAEARPMIHAADVLGDVRIHKPSILLECAIPTGALVRRSLTMSVIPVWLETLMDQVPSILEWLRVISTSSDGLYELVSEALRKPRSRSSFRIPQFTHCITKGCKIRSFLMDRMGRGLHSSAHAFVASIMGEDLYTWASKIEATYQKRYRIHGEEDDYQALFTDCENEWIAHFIHSVTMHPASQRHEKIRDGRARLVQQYFTSIRKGNLSALELLVHWDCALQKRTAKISHALLREHMLDKGFRRDMLEVYARTYRSMTNLYVKGLGNMSESIFDFAVQFLTIPSVVKEFTCEQTQASDSSRPQLVSELLDALHSVLASAVVDKDGPLQLEHGTITSQKYKHCIDDLEFVVNIGALSNELVCQVSNLKRWIGCLQLLENGDAQVRRGVHQSHVEYESETWLTMFNLGIRIHSIFSGAWNGVTLEELQRRKHKLRESFQVIVQATVTTALRINKTVTKVTLFPIKYLPRLESIPEAQRSFDSYAFNVAHQSVSLHLPLHRFLAASIRHMTLHQSECPDTYTQRFLESFALDALSRDERLELIELPLRSLVMASQIHVNLWRRNGEEMMSAQLFNYTALPYCINYRDADIFLMQMAIQLVGADHVLAIMVDRYQVGSFLRHPLNTQCDNLYMPPEDGIEESNVQQLVEELLRLIIIIGTNVPSTVGTLYTDAFLREEMLQHLCAKSYPFSKLSEVAILPTGQDEVSIGRLESVLSQVADFKSPSDLEPGQYVLKDGLLEQYNPYFLHLNREAHELARDRWTKYRKTERKKRRETGIPVSPPSPLKAPLSPIACLRPVQNILSCESTVTLIHVILWKVVSSMRKKDTSVISDAVVSTCLHLLVYGLYAVLESNDTSFWDRLCDVNDALDKSSVVSLLYVLGREHGSESILDDEQEGTLEWLLWKIKDSSTVCALVLDEARKNDEAVVVGVRTEPEPTTLDQRKADARRRALEAISRQQSAFQTMMASMAEDDVIDDDDAQADNTAFPGKRRLSIDNSVEDHKRRRVVDDDDSCFKCILCHDTSKQGEMGLAAYVHQSTVLSTAFRPGPDEALKPIGAQLRQKIKILMEKMDLCSGGPNDKSSHTFGSPTMQAVAANLSEWYLHTDALEDELNMLDTPMPRQLRNRVPDITDNELLQTDEELEMFVGGTFNDRLFPLQEIGARRGGANIPPPTRRRTFIHEEFDSSDSEFEYDEPRFIHHAQMGPNHHHTSQVMQATNYESAKLFLTPCGLHIRSCQHAVHIHCLERYIRSLQEKAMRGEEFDGVQAIDQDSAMTQFLCPLCKTLCNFLIPTSDPTTTCIDSDAVDKENRKELTQWYDIVNTQLNTPGWYRSVLGRNGDFGNSDISIHDMWRDYFEETLWEPHGSLEKGAPFMWSACAFSLASFLVAADFEFRNSSRTNRFYDPLSDACPPSLEKELGSLIVVSKFCRWSFSLMEHSEDAKVIWETAKRCCPINTETKRGYRKFTKVLGSIDACLRGSILGLLVADTFTAFVISCVIADSPMTIWKFMPIFSTADILQRLYAECFAQKKSDERSLLQDKFSIADSDKASVHCTVTPASSKSTKSKEGRPTRTSRSQPSESKLLSATQTLESLLKEIEDDTTEEYAAVILLQRIVKSDPTEQLKQLSVQELKNVLDRTKSANLVLVQRMKLFWRCFTDREPFANPPYPLQIPSLADIASCDDQVYEQVWTWCVDRINSKSFLGVAKDGDKCEHADGCGEAYFSSMFVLRDLTEKPQLINLPIQYDELYSAMSGRKCGRCEKTPSDPGICLICGEFLCCGDSCCTRPFMSHSPPVGECTRHAAECGGGIGIVLLLDQCRVAILGGSMAAYFPCPYVDSHGEEDIGLQRGRPLRLDIVRYQYLESLWVNQQIFAEVSRQRNLREPHYAMNHSYL